MSPCVFLVFSGSAISSWTWPRMRPNVPHVSERAPLLCHSIWRPSMAHLEVLAEARRLHPTLGRSLRLDQSAIQCQHCGAPTRTSRTQEPPSSCPSYHPPLRANFRRHWQWERARRDIGWSARTPTRQAAHWPPRGSQNTRRQRKPRSSHARPRRPPSFSVRAPTTRFCTGTADRLSDVPPRMAALAPGSSPLVADRHAGDRGDAYVPVGECDIRNRDCTKIT